MSKKKRITKEIEFRVFFQASIPEERLQDPEFMAALEAVAQAGLKHWRTEQNKNEVPDETTTS